MIVVDSSALIAILQGEPRSPELQAILLDERALLSTANYVETAIVAELRARTDPRRAVEGLERMIALFGIELVPFDEEQARAAIAARLRFGKGFGHRRGLNFGDSFAYALAKTRNLPLLYVGDDFSITDITPARP